MPYSSACVVPIVEVEHGKVPSTEQPSMTCRAVSLASTAVDIAHDETSKATWAPGVVRRRCAGPGRWTPTARWLASTGSGSVAANSSM